MNSRIRILIAASLALVAIACASSAPVPAVQPEGDDRYLVDPRLGYDGAIQPASNRRLENAWRSLLSGDAIRTRRELEQLRQRDPGLLVTELIDAAVAIREGAFDRALTTIADIEKKKPNYIAAWVYDAEIAVRQHNLRHAHEIYAQLAKSQVPDEVRARAVEVRQRLLGEINAAAQSAASPAEAVRLLREALAIDPSSRSTRLQLVQNLVRDKKWDLARQQLEPLLTADSERAEVQEALAEIEVGRGLYEQAISRYERLARRDNRYTQRLDAIKERWNAANMPPQFIRALESEAITRGDLAVLLYWKVPAIRFAQNLTTPPIAVDVNDVVGREEVIRAIAVGMLQVDPITRRVNPSATVTPAQVSRYLARVMTIRGASCARGASDTSRILSSCGMKDLGATLPPDASVTGSAAVEVINQMAKQL